MESCLEDRVESVCFGLPSVKNVFEVLTVLAMGGGGGGGGGLIGPDDHIISCHSKRLTVQPSNLVSSSFYLLSTFWMNFSKIDLPGRLLPVTF